MTCSHVNRSAYVDRGVLGTQRRSRSKRGVSDRQGVVEREVVGTVDHGPQRGHHARLDVVVGNGHPRDAHADAPLGCEPTSRVDGDL
jgi:hypothetical protein